MGDHSVSQNIQKECSMMLTGVFLIGLLASFIGSLPLGVLNLSVIQLSGTRSLNQGYLFSFGASVIELIQAFIAIWFAEWFLRSSELGNIFQLIAIPILIGLGVYYLRQKKYSNPSETRTTSKMSGFTKGVLLSVANPVAIPFWIFYSAWFYSNQWITYEFPIIIALVAGIAGGTFLCLALYGTLGQYLYTKLSAYQLRINQLIGSVFIILALLQGVDILMSHS